MTTTKTLSATVRSQTEGERRWFFGGGVHVWKATSEETGGAFLLFEALLDAGKVTPLHTHPDSDETTYVLDGEIRMHMDGREHFLAAGGVAVAPRGVPHAFLVISPSARLLFLHTPGSCQDFYFGASEPLAVGAPDGEVDFARIQASARDNGGITLLGPPPFTPK